MKEAGVADKSFAYRLLANVITGSVLLLIVEVQGCDYLKFRADDFVWIVDIGFTILNKPCFAYIQSESLTFMALVG
jgi:hypothetical protein